MIETLAFLLSCAAGLMGTPEPNLQPQVFTFLMPAAQIEEFQARSSYAKPSDRWPRGRIKVFAATQRRLEYELAHEAVHHLQALNGLPYDELQARIVGFTCIDEARVARSSHFLPAGLSAKP